MFENLLFITRQVSYVFFSSIVSSYFICLISNVPFYNPNLSKLELINTLKDSSFNLGIITLEVIFSAYLYYSYIDFEKHSIITTFINIVEYSFLIELFYYFYHRILHTTNLYSLIHAKHHSNIKVYPIDTLNISILDSTGMIITLIAPLYFIKVNLNEYNFIMYIYLTGAILTHSNLLVSKHIEHHEKFKCNFAFLFPIFDYIFGTLNRTID
jgi:sterol desaturase/sphingolipid hydroxylase (fatty acid hydroxylase superfamily)